MTHSKTFSKEEISKILTEASEIQISKSDSNTLKEGVSAEELFQIAEEVGISPKILEQAIQKIQTKATSKFNWLLGSSELQSSIILEDEVSDLQLDRLFPELNAFTGQKGEVDKVGQSYDWEQIENGLETVRRVTVIPQKEKAKIIHYVNWNDFRYLGLGLSAFFGALGLSLILKSFGIPKSTYFLLSPIGAMVGYFSFMGGLKYYFNDQKKKFESIMQLITDIFERPAQHRLTIDDAPQKSEEEKQTQKSKTRS